MEHGHKTYLGGCRCSTCRAANARYHRDWQDNRLPSAVPHGSDNGYVNYRCRCEQCRAAHASKMREYRSANR